MEYLNKSKLEFFIKITISLYNNLSASNFRFELSDQIGPLNRVYLLLGKSETPLSNLIECKIHYITKKISRRVGTIEIGL